MRALKIFFLIFLAFFPALSLYPLSPADYFVIKIVDEETGRGVPLVELSTVNNMLYYTDNNGIVAFYEPGLMNTEVFFNIKSHGYEFPADGFGYRGKRLFTKPGSRVELKIKRLNIAERLYRITGYGLYRDSVLAGEPIPIKQPLLNGRVFGQDTVISAIYKGKIYWFWGDTTKPDYPLGNFAVSGATSDLPANGGLPPSVGINLAYFTNSDGFCKSMCPIKAPGMKWLEGLLVLTNKDGEEKLFARYAAVKDLGHVNEVGLVVFNDQKQEFEHVLTYPTKEGAHHSSHPVLINWNGKPYLYLFPTLRVPADIEAIKDMNQFENFTCVRSYSESGSCEIERDTSGKPLYHWRKGIAPFNPNIHNTLIRKGLIRPEESWIMLHDIATGKPTARPQFFNGSVFWNGFRKSWIMITMGSAGEIWFSEADTPTGPWVYARLIVNHDKYNFYNPTQHPFFDEKEGRIIYFEGTYTAAFSSAPAPTPAFEYNQIMYRLDLSDPRLVLPAPVYEVRMPDGKFRYMMKAELDSEKLYDNVSRIAFYAILPARILNGMIKIIALLDSGQFRLDTEAAIDSGKGKTVFAALPPADKSLTTEIMKSADTKTLASLKDLETSSTLLYEYKLNNDAFLYSTDDNLKLEHKSKRPLCRVWKNPLSVLPADFHALPPTTNP